MDKVLRNLFLALGKSRTATNWAGKYGMKLGAGRFVAGETIATAITAVQELNRQGLMATLDHLGEYVGSEEEAAASAAVCLQTLDAIAAAGVKANLSLKLTSLGLDLSRELCHANMEKILKRASQYGNFVRIDMEDYTHCQVSLDMYRELRRQYDQVGIVIQAYLYRSEQDVKDLAALAANLRLVKGAYKESHEVAFPDKPDVDENMFKLAQLHLLNENYTAIATHDVKLIERLRAFIRNTGISRAQYEFQMLYGIGEPLQRQLVQEGERVRVYVPFGEDWYGYFMRRLAERPANVGFVLRNLLK